MRARRLPRSARFAAALLVFASLSCSDRHDLATRPTVATEPTGASAVPVPSSSQPGFYPLTTGNHWSYREEAVYQLYRDSVGALPPPEHYVSTSTVDIGAPATADGRDYLGEVTTIFGAGPPTTFTTLVRQDATGLYEWSPFRTRVRVPVPAGRSPAETRVYAAAALELEARIAAVARVGAGAFRLPPTASPSEVTRLRYPLEFKSQWRISTDRRFNSSAVVVGQESLDLPPGRLLGWRLDVISDALRPTDYLHMWYGTAGFLQQVSHFEVPATDASGNVIGNVVYDDRQWLTDYQLAPPSTSHPSPAWPPRRPK